MRCEHCGGDLVEVDNPMCREVRHRRGAVCSGGLPDSQPPRPPAVDAPEPQTPPVSGTETGTGGLNRHEGAQAGECSCPWTDPSTWTTYGDATEPGSQREWEPSCPEHGDPSTVYIEPATGVAVVSARQNGKTAAAIAAAVEAARPVHLNEAAASLNTIAEHMPGRHPEFVRGIRYAATLLAHTADDEGDQDA